MSSQQQPPQQPPENNLELESQFILRLPLEQAHLLRSAIRSGSSLSNRLSIQLNNDMRHGSVRFDDCTLQAKLLDLPTIIESYKTLDKKNLYKTADISQILICEDKNEENEPQDNQAKNNKREFSFPHGITPPLKSVRKRRFRKTMKKKFVDTTEMEKEVRRLFQFDCRAINVRYEVIEENRPVSEQQTFATSTAAVSPASDTNPGMQSTENSQNIDLLHEMFGEEISGSSDESDEDDDDEEKDEDPDAGSALEIESDNEHESEDNDIVGMEEDTFDAFANELSQPAAPVDIAAEEAAASDLIAQNDDNEEKRLELNKELAKIRERIEVQKSEMNGLDNIALRQRLQSVLDSLYEQESEIKNQIESLSKYG